MQELKLMLEDAQLVFHDGGDHYKVAYGDKRRHSLSSIKLDPPGAYNSKAVLECVAADQSFFKIRKQDLYQTAEQYPNRLPTNLNYKPEEDAPLIQYIYHKLLTVIGVDMHGTMSHEKPTIYCGPEDDPLLYRDGTFLGGENGKQILQSISNQPNIVLFVASNAYKEPAVRFIKKHNLESVFTTIKTREDYYSLGQNAHSALSAKCFIFAQLHQSQLSVKAIDKDGYLKLADFFNPIDIIRYILIDDHPIEDELSLCALTGVEFMSVNKEDDCLHWRTLQQSIKLMPTSVPNIFVENCKSYRKELEIAHQGEKVAVYQDELQKAVMPIISFLYSMIKEFIQKLNKSKEATAESYQELFALTIRTLDGIDECLEQIPEPPELREDFIKVERYISCEGIKNTILRDLLRMANVDKDRIFASDEKLNINYHKNETQLGDEILKKNLVSITEKINDPKYTNDALEALVNLRIDILRADINDFKQILIDLRKIRQDTVLSQEELITRAARGFKMLEELVVKFIRTQYNPTFFGQTQQQAGQLLINSTTIANNEITSADSIKISNYK